MAFIGSLEFFSIRYGTPARPGKKTEDITRPGVDGVGVREIATAGAPYQLLCVEHLENEGAVNTFMAALAELEGTIVTVTPDVGNARDDTWIISVDPPQIMAALNSTNEFRAEVSIECQDTSTS